MSFCEKEIQSAIRLWKVVEWLSHLQRDPTGQVSPGVQSSDENSLQTKPNFDHPTHCGNSAKIHKWWEELELQVPKRSQFATKDHSHWANEWNEGTHIVARERMHA